MLLIIFLGLIATLELVSGDCDGGTPTINDFDWSRFSGPRPWYFQLHLANDFEDNVDCPVGTFASPEGNRSLITADLHHIREQHRLKHNGYATNWNSSGYFEINHAVSMWNGRSYVIAIDYDRYFIYKHCHFDTSNLTIYVAYRNRRPDEGTVNDVRKHLEDNNIDVNQMVEFRGNHCPHTEWSTEGGSPALNLTLP